MKFLISLLLLIGVVGCSWSEIPNSSQDSKLIHLRDTQNDVRYTLDNNNLKGKYPHVTNLIKHYAKIFGVPENLAFAIAIVESHLDSNAVRYESHLDDSSIGVYQVLGATADWFCGIKDPKQLFDPATNVECGISYLAWQLERYGSVEKAIVAYNAGSVVICKTGKQVKRFRCRRGDYINRGYLRKVERLL